MATPPRITVPTRPVANTADPASFATLADKFGRELPTFGEQANTLADWMNEQGAAFAGMVAEVGNAASHVAYRFSIDAETNAELTVGTSDGSPYIVLWGDNQRSLSPSGASVSHVYGVPYTGDVTVLVPVGSLIRVLTSFQGRWDFDVSEIPASVETFNFGASNRLRGSLDTIRALGLTTLRIAGNNTVSGGFAAIKNMSRLARLEIGGANTTRGDVQYLPRSLTEVVVEGANTWIGDVAAFWAMPALKRLVLGGAAEVTGSTAGVAASALEDLQIMAGNVGGTLADLVGSKLHTVNMGGTRTTFGGNISRLKETGIRHFFASGLNTLTGSLSGLVGSLLETFRVSGNNTIGGDTGDLVDTPITNFRLTGSNNVQAVTNRMRTRMGYFELKGVSRTQTQLEAITRALTKVTTWIAPGEVDLTGSNPTPNATSQGHIATIRANGATVVLTN